MIFPVAGDIESILPHADKQKNDHSIMELILEHYSMQVQQWSTSKVILLNVYYCSIA